MSVVDDDSPATFSDSDDYSSNYSGDDPDNQDKKYKLTEELDNTSCILEDIDNIMEVVLLEEESEINRDQQSTRLDNIEWKEYEGNQKQYVFKGTSGLLRNLPDQLNPMEAFSLFIDEDVIDLLVTETNRYAERKINKKQITKHARINKWVATNSDEMKKFLGLIIWMGLVRLDSLPNYWSTSPIYNFQHPRSTMSRNRFELLLTNLHFADDNAIEDGNAIGKILPLLTMLQNKYQAILSPGEDFIVHESVVPWRGKLICNNYAPEKAYKYGIKVFKLCSTEGYTWSMKVTAGKPTGSIKQEDLTQNVCHELAQKLLNEGRTMYIDNFYTSYELALSFLRQQTHVVGMVSGDKKCIPKEISNYCLKEGEIVSREDNNGIVMLKWKNIKDIRILSTKHAPVVLKGLHDVSPTGQPSTSFHCQIPKKLPPLAVAAYNSAVSNIPRSYQSVSYVMTLRKGMNWFRKIGLQLILGVSLVNAAIVYRLATKRKIKIRTFREMLAERLLELKSNQTSGAHNITIRKDENGKKIRRICVLCYTKRKQMLGRVEARKNVKKSMTYCPDCPKQPQLCLECFTDFHAR